MYGAIYAYFSGFYVWPSRALWVFGCSYYEGIESPMPSIQVVFVDLIRSNRILPYVLFFLPTPFYITSPNRVKRQIWIIAFMTRASINNYSIKVSREAWGVCQREILSLLQEIDAASSETARTRLNHILYGQADYDKATVARALKGLNPKLLLKIDSAERSIFCGAKGTRCSDDTRR